MPKAMEYIPPNDPRRDSLMAIGGTEKRDRQEAYNKARDYYNGIQKRQLDKKDNEPNDNVVLNVTQQAIDRTVSFLFPALPKFETDPDATVLTANEEWIEAVFSENGGIAWAHELAMHGALGGHVYVRLMPKDDEYPFPQAVILDPTTVQTYWRADDIRKVVWHEIFYEIETFNGINQTVQEMYIIDFVNRGNRTWDIIQYRNVTGSGVGWVLQPEFSSRWSAPTPPIIHWKHLPNPGQFYGRSEATHLDLNDKLNLIASENNRIIRYHSSPHTVATGVSADGIKRTSIDSLWAIENSDAQVFNLEMKTELQAAASQQQILHDAYLAQSRVVILQGEVKDFQRVTNAGVRTVFIDALAKNSILRWNYGYGLQQVAKGLFLLGGKGEIVPDIMWPDPLPVDDLERVTIAKMERDMNVVSRQTVSVQRGYNWDSESAKMEAESNMEFLQPVSPFGAPQPGQNDPNADPKQPLDKKE